MKRLFTLNQLNESEEAYIKFKNKEDITSYRTLRRISSGIIKLLGERDLSSNEKTDIIDFSLALSLNKYDPMNSEGFFMDVLHANIKNEINNIKKQKEGCCLEDLFTDIEGQLGFLECICSTADIDKIEAKSIVEKLYKDRYKNREDVVETIRKDVHPEAFINIIKGSNDAIFEIENILELNRVMNDKKIMPQRISDFDGDLMGKIGIDLSSLIGSQAKLHQVISALSAMNIL